MKYYFNVVLCFFVFLSPQVISGETLSQSVNVNLSLNIAPPVCKLTDATQTIDFGEVQPYDITMGNVKKDATFFFTDCTNVNNVTISFSGANIDKNRNLIKNKSGTDNATGIGIKLYDIKKKEINLNEKQEINVNKENSFNFQVSALVVKENENGVAVTAGKIDTSVNMNITYN
ncbi:fimbrial protein [Escherichia albertii]|uniref:fimbrial protein n=1 Tax=Escherichia albertii TaxID=208962 RepID=UPI0009304ABE|nr:fimbrial protein [Escherichia albertii]QTA28824.1 type 1 fimbrial protein [Escherichia albertii]